MKTVYKLGDDLFVAVAFVSFIIGIILRLMGIEKIWAGVTPKGIIFFSMICLLFSIALSLYDLALKKE